MNAALDCCDTREKRREVRDKGSEREWGKTKFEHQADIDTVWIKAEERERESVKQNEPFGRRKEKEDRREEREASSILLIPKPAERRLERIIPPLLFGL